MNTLRALPILNRPSRPSSPAPPAQPSTQTSTMNAFAQPASLGLGLSHAASEPGKPRSKSLQKQVVDRVSSFHAGGATKPAPSSQPPGSRGPSPPSSRVNTPQVPNGALPPGDPVATPSSGHMEIIGLRLNESVNKACAGVEFKARKGFRKGAGWAVGEAVVKELPIPPSDAYLIRAVLRTAVRSMSIYITRLESLLLPALTDPAFISPLNLHPPTVTSHPLNPVQYFAVSIAHAAWETCEVLEQTLETGSWPKFVNEALRPVMDKFDLVVGKVVQPLLVALKRDLVSALARTDGASPSGKPIGIASLPAPTTAPTTTKDSAPGRLVKEVSSGGTSRQLPIPLCLQYFASRVDGAKRILEIIAVPCAEDGEGWITGVAVTVIWKGMCVIAEKDVGAAHRPPSPGSVAKALHNLALKENGTAHPVPPAHTGANGVTPASIGLVTAKLTNIIPARTASRAPSPPRQSSKWDSTTHALLSLEGLVKRLLGGMVRPSTRSTANESTTEHIAREALHEAIEALESFRTVSTSMHVQPHPSAKVLASCRRIRDDIDDLDEEALDDAMEDTPAVLLYSISIRQANKALSMASLLQKSTDPEKAPVKSIEELRIRHPSEIWGWRPAEYERQVLGGFGQAEEWAKRVAVALKPEIERVMSSLAEDIAISQAASKAEMSGEDQANAQSKAVRRELIEAVEWVRCLGVLCDARGGVKVLSAS